MNSPILERFRRPSRDNQIADQYKDNRWMIRAERIRTSKGNYCLSCRRADVPLSVHHINYRNGAKLWEYKDNEFVCLCSDCHDRIHAAISAFRAIASRSNATNVCAIVGLVDQLIKKHGDRDAALMIARLL